MYNEYFQVNSDYVTGCHEVVVWYTFGLEVGMDVDCRFSEVKIVSICSISITTNIIQC